MRAGIFASFQDATGVSLSAPVLSITQTKRSQWVVDWTDVSGATYYDYQVSEGIEFNLSTLLIDSSSLVSQASGDFDDVSGIDRFYLRARARSGSDFSAWSTTTQIILDSPVSMGALGFTAQALDSSSIQLQCNELEPVGTNSTYLLKRGSVTLYNDDGSGQISGGKFTFIDSSGLSSSTTYNYTMQVSNSSPDYLTATGAASATTDSPAVLNTPTGLSVSETGVDGTVRFNWNDVVEATSYDVKIDGVFNQNVADSSADVSGLTVEQQYTFGVLAKAAGYADSALATINYTPQSSSGTFFTAEQFGAEAYYKPLDGRTELSTTFPTITYTPYSVDNTITSGTGLVGTDYTKITSSKANTFTSDDLNKEFCGLFAHRNPETADTSQVDLYVPNIVGSRYCNVVYVLDDRNIIVDFEFNGGNRDTPQIKTNAKGYIFKDNSDLFTSVFNGIYDGTGITELRLLPYTVDANYKTTCYVLRDPKSYLAKNTKNMTIYTGTTSRARIKVWPEDYYAAELSKGTAFYDHNDHVFYVEGNADFNFVVHNVEIVPPHRYVGYAVSMFRYVFAGDFDKTGITALINSHNKNEYNAISSGTLGITSEFFLLESSSRDRGGSDEGSSNVTDDVVDFEFEFYKNCDFAGDTSAGQKVTTRGSFMTVADDCTFDFNPQESFNPSSIALSIRLIDDYSGMPTSAQTRAGGDYYSYIWEVNDNLFRVLSSQPEVRSYIIAVEADDGDTPLVFMCTNEGGEISQGRDGIFSGHYDWFYSINSPRNTWGRTTTTSPHEYAYTNSKVMTYEQIPEVGETYLVSWDYDASGVFLDDFQLSNTDPRTPATIVSRKSKSIRTAIAWTTILQKLMVDIDPSADKIPEFGRPLGIQYGDQFTIPAYVKVSSVTGTLVEGDAIDNGSGVSAVIDRFTEYNSETVIYLASVTGGTFAVSDTISSTSSGNLTSATVDEVSSHDSAKIYTAARKERGVQSEFPAECPLTANRFDTYYERVNFSKYKFFYLVLDDVLPTSLPDTFCITMVKSRSESLLDYQYRNGRVTFRSNRYFGSLAGDGQRVGSLTYALTGGQTLNDDDFKEPDVAGHLAYSQAENTYYFRNCDFNDSYWRQNNSNEPKSFTLASGRKSQALKVMSKGHVLINCTNPMIGQWSEGDEGGNQWETTRQIIEDYSLPTPSWATDNGIKYPPKYYIYNTPDAVIGSGIDNPTYSVEQYATDADAPDLPTPILTLLSGLPS